MEKLSIAFSDHVIISNDIWYETLISRAVKKEKCTAILNYPDPDIFHKQSRTRKNNKFIIMYPGSLNWHQGLDIAIKAIAIIKDQVPETELHIYGDGPSKCSLIDMVSQLGLENRVFFRDSLYIDEIANVMANADLGIVPKRANSFGNEAFSTKILEFMALGVPVLISKTKIDQFYFDDSLVTFFESGNEKELAEKILLLIGDENIRKKQIVNCDKYIDENNWNVKKNVYLDIIGSFYK